MVKALSSSFSEDGCLSSLKQAMSGYKDKLFINCMVAPQEIYVNYEKEGCLVHTIRYEDLSTEPEQELLIATNFLYPSKKK